jgi:hypothetical protein
MFRALVPFGVGAYDRQSGPVGTHHRPFGQHF